MPLKRLNNKVRITSLVLAILGSALFGYALLNGSLTSRKRPSKAGKPPPSTSPRACRPRST
jgi:hypothetical protein